MSYERSSARRLLEHLQGPRRFIQVVSGPRQVGKTTAVLQVLEQLGAPFHYASADDPHLQRPEWIRQQWEIARDRGPHGKVVLALDEVQKVSNWSDIVKSLWDEDTRAKRRLHVVVLGSSPLLVEKGLGESLAGRFEIVRMSHWSLDEMHAAFKWDVDRFVLFGGYPGAAPLIGEPERWRRYILDSLVETTLSRDILLLTRVDKPALLRQLFDLACACSGQILSFNKMLGQLHDAGNTTTLAHYLHLLSGAGMVTGIPKFARRPVATRASSPKLIVRNTALATATARRAPSEIRSDAEAWGRWAESAVGAHLLNDTVESSIDVAYWRDPKGREVDFVLSRGKAIVAIEVKTGHTKSALSGLDGFAADWKPVRTLLVGPGGVSLREFLETPVENWFR